MPTEYGLSNPKSSVPCTTSLEKPVGNVNPFPGRVKWGGGEGGLSSPNPQINGMWEM